MRLLVNNKYQTNKDCVIRGIDEYYCYKEKRKKRAIDN